MKNFYRICTVAALALVIGYFIWPASKPARREPEIARAKPIAPRVQAFNDAIVEPPPAPPAPAPSLAPEPPSEPAPQDIVEEPIAQTDNSYEEPVDDDETIRKELEEEFHALTDEIEELGLSHPDREMVQQEVREVVDALSGLMRKMGLSAYEAPNGWFVVEEPSGNYTYGNGK